MILNPGQAVARQAPPAPESFGPIKPQPCQELCLCSCLQALRITMDRIAGGNGRGPVPEEQLQATLVVWAVLGLGAPFAFGFGQSLPRSRPDLAPTDLPPPRDLFPDLPPKSSPPDLQIPAQISPQISPPNHPPDLPPDLPRSPRSPPRSPRNLPQISPQMGPIPSERCGQNVSVKTFSQNVIGTQTLYNFYKP